MQAQKDLPTKPASYCLNSMLYLQTKSRQFWEFREDNLILLNSLK